MVTKLETLLTERVNEAKALLEEFEDLDPTSAGYAEAARQASFIRGVVAGLNYSIRRARELEATCG